MTQCPSAPPPRLSVCLSVSYLSVSVCLYICLSVYISSWSSSVTHCYPVSSLHPISSTRHLSIRCRHYSRRSCHILPTSWRLVSSTSGTLRSLALQPLNIQTLWGDFCWHFLTKQLLKSGLLWVVESPWIFFPDFHGLESPWKQSWSLKVLESVSVGPWKGLN